MPLNNQFKTPGSIVTNTEYQEVINNINYLNDLITANAASLLNLQNKADSFKAVAGSGLTIIVKGGLLKRVSDGTILNIPDQNVFVPASVTNRFLYIDRTGTAVLATSIGKEAYDIGLISSDATTITSIVDQRSNAFEIKLRQTRKVIHANKTGSLAIVSGGSVQTISGWTTSNTWSINENGSFSGGGIFTIYKATEHDIFCRVAIESPAPTDLSAKLSLYVGSTELRILDERPLGVNATRSILQGTHSDVFNVGDQISLRIAIGSGSGVFIPNNNNTELIIKMLG